MKGHIIERNLILIITKCDFFGFSQRLTEWGLRSDCHRFVEDFKICQDYLRWNFVDVKLFRVKSRYAFPAPKIHNPITAFKICVLTVFKGHKPIIQPVISKGFSGWIKI